MAKPCADLLVTGAGQLVTPCGKGPAIGDDLGRLRIIADGAVAVAGERVLAVGTTDEVLSQVETGPATVLVDAGGCVVLPGLVDPHTHALYAGSRQRELEMKLRGLDYLAILASGGGILSTVSQTRAAQPHYLGELLRERLRVMLAHGTTTVEIKTGYGLTEADELAHLEILARLEKDGLPDVVATLMAAHAVPEEWTHDPDGYIDLIRHRIIPAAAAAGTAKFVDVFCESGVFSREQTRLVLVAAREHGLSCKLHADELTPGGGAELAAETGAISAEHLIHTSPEGVKAMAAAGVIAVLLPGTSFYLAKGAYAPARAMIEAGVPVALATDANPGTSPTENMGFMLTLACLYLRMTPAEAVTAATLNAACALGLGDQIGSLEPGKLADLAVFAAPDYQYLPYHYGVNLTRTVIKRGRVVWHSPSAPPSVERGIMDNKRRI